MFKKSVRHLQPVLISNVNDLPEKQRERLASSWSGVFFCEFHCRVDEQPFAVLYADFPSRPNAPVNELVSLEFLKAGNDWSDEEMYDHYLFDLQTRHALGLDVLGEAHFDLRTVYNFRLRLSQHMQATGVNLLDQAFEQVTDEQIAAFGLKTGQQRMDSTLVASNIRRAGRLQLLVEVLQRTHRMLNADEQAHYAEVLAPYLKGHAGQYVYRLKSGDYPRHMQQVGEVMQRLLVELEPAHSQDPAYQVLARVFSEHFKVEAETVTAKPNEDLTAASLQSPDDLEATYRQKRGVGSQGYVANLSETCEPQNPFQLITKVQTAPNVTDDSQLLAEALPNLKARTDLHTIYTDGSFGGPLSDPVLAEQNVTLVQTAIRGRDPHPDQLHLADFAIEFNQNNKPAKAACPQGQVVPVHPTSQHKAFIARFALEACAACPLADKCPTRPGQREPRRTLRFTQAEAQASERRRRSRKRQQEAGNLRSAIEATVRSVKRPFPAGKLPVRGQFRVACMLVGSAAVANVRRIQRFLAAKNEAEKQQKVAQSGRNGLAETAAVSFWGFVLASWRRLRSPQVAFGAVSGC